MIPTLQLKPRLQSMHSLLLTLFFFIRTSNFLAEAEQELNVLIFLAI